MQRQNYMITAEEVAESMGISLGYAYKLLRKLNKELADQGYVTVAGKIPRAFWEKKFYGDRKRTRLNSSHQPQSRMPASA